MEKMIVKPGKTKNHIIVTNPEQVVDPHYLLGAVKMYNTDNDWRVERNYINYYQLGLRNLIPQLIWKSIEPLAKAVAVAKLDPDLEEGLFDYQKLDVHRGMVQKQYMNANPMGYGKTVETVATLRSLGVKNTLVLAPKPVLLQWQKEFMEWWSNRDTSVRCPNIRVLHAGEAVPSVQECSESIIITNYESLQNKDRLQTFQSLNWDCLVLDESHRIKNGKKSMKKKGSQVWQNVTTLQAKRKMWLTGTPILSYVDDLWAQLWALDPLYVGNSYWNFVHFFCTVRDGHFGKEIGGLSRDPEKVRLLNWLVDLATIRHKDLKLTPGKNIHIIPLRMDDKQRKYYATARELVFENLPEELTISNAMTHLLRLRQLTSCPEQFFEDSSNIKFDWIENVLTDNPDIKLVVFSEWSTPLVHLAKRLGKQMVLYHGKQSEEQNEKAKQMFISNSNTRVIGGTIGSMGTGVDELQKGSNKVVFLDRNWSPEINKQAMDRLDRIGQKEVVDVYFLEAKGSMDKHVARINLTKAEDIKLALQEEL